MKLTVAAREHALVAVVVAAVTFVLSVATVAVADDAAREALARSVAAFAGGDPSALSAAVSELGTSTDPVALTVLEALDEKTLRLDAAGRAFIAAESGLVDALSGKSVPAQSGLITPIVNNAVRRSLRLSLSQLRLRAPDAETRRVAAEDLVQAPSPETEALLLAALKSESDADTRAALELAVAQIDLASDDLGKRLVAVEAIAASGELKLKPLLEQVVAKTEGAKGPELQLRRAAQDGLLAFGRKELGIRVLRDLIYGASLGSVLLLAALGLAITFGLMGVINMAHGEMLMIGAYTTFVVQNAFAKYAPGALDWYLACAVPAAFLVSMLVGVLLERLIIRHLYGRPLETLLATFGISLCLIQLVRLGFGAQNVTVANPSWLSGGYDLATGVVVPYARIATIGFVVAVVFFVYYVLQRTGLGLQLRATTQNRAMARCMGIPTPRIDMLTFGIGSGVAGLGGVALSQLGNVGPELGQGYIVDSFMVVVLGGVGKLAGTVVAATGLGVVNKLLEPVSGAVLGKIIVLGFIVLFIQRRPQGLFAPKGRAAEA